MGSIEYEDGNFEKALEHWKKAETSNTALPRLHLRLGDAYLQCRLLTEARAAYEKAIEDDPDNPRAHLGQALVALRERKYEEAAEEGPDHGGNPALLPPRTLLARHRPGSPRPIGTRPPWPSRRPSL